jgi:nitric oxide reductase NorE protein
MLQDHGRPDIAMNSTAAVKSAGHIPGELGVWVIIFGDMTIFGLLFCTYLYYRGAEPQLFTQSQLVLNRDLGATNTLLLLTSSWFIAMAVQFARLRRGRPIPWLIGGAIACGIGFGMIKIIEYHAKFAAGINISTNDFFMFYFVLTGIHFMHLILATGFLIYVWRRSLRATWGQKDIAILEIGATFWHLVDLLWIVLFPLLYLVR